MKGGSCGALVMSFPWHHVTFLASEITRFDSSSRGPVFQSCPLLDEVCWCLYGAIDEEMAIVASTICLMCEILQ